MLKIFKNQVSYATKMGKSLYYDICEDVKDTFCAVCQAKYTVIDTKYAPCQKIEVLALSNGKEINGGDKNSVKPLQLNASISTCWLVDPFINMVDVGDVINLTAFYYMSP